MKAFYTGRFDLVRPLRLLTVQEHMTACFDRYLILCRETAAAYGMSWQDALSLLRVQEYTGQVRRGYFVEGLSGAQFIRKEDFEAVIANNGNDAIREEHLPTFRGRQPHSGTACRRRCLNDREKYCGSLIRNV